MTDRERSASGGEIEALRREIARLNKVVEALVGRSESAASGAGSSYGLFQTTITLREEVHRRTRELESALRANEAITRDLRASEARFRGLVNQSLVGIAMVEDGRITYANPKAAEMFGYGVDELLGVDPVELVRKDDRQLVKERVLGRLRGEVEDVDFVVRGVHKGGSIVDVEVHPSRMEIGGLRTVILLVLDVSERVRAEREVLALQARLREQAIRDPLTGLYNRRHLVEMFGRELALAERAGRPVSVVMGDLDHFKVANDTYGHLAGDAVLKALADLLKRKTRGSDVPCRYGGEEFVLILPGMGNADACARAEALRVAFAATRTVCDEAVVRCTISFGVATYPDDGTTTHALIAAADEALFAAKRAGRDRVVNYRGRGG